MSFNTVIDNCLKSFGLKGKISEKFIRYVITGLIAFAVDYSAFLSLYYLAHVPLQVSVPTGIVLATIVNFIMNKFWTFNATRQTSLHHIVTQLCLYGLLVAINSIFSYYFIHYLNNNHISPSIGKIMAIVICAAWNYFFYKLAIFRKNITLSVID
jgi:putative flippase GtrA